MKFRASLDSSGASGEARRVPVPPRRDAGCQIRHSPACRPVLPQLPSDGRSLVRRLGFGPSLELLSSVASREGGWNSCRADSSRRSGLSRRSRTKEDAETEVLREGGCTLGASRKWYSPLSRRQMDHRCFQPRDPRPSNPLPAWTCFTPNVTEARTGPLDDARKS